MYSEKNQYYDFTFAMSKKNYKTESKKLVRIINKINKDARTILDVSCGTGEHDKYLKSNFSITGIDLHNPFLQIARSKNPELEYVYGDMRTFSLSSQFDVVISLFSSIGFLESVEELDLTIKNFRKHLNPGGLIIIEPWFTPSVWKTAFPFSVQFHNKRNEKYFRLARNKTEGRFSILHEHHLYANKENMVHFEEKINLFMFTHEEMVKTIEDNGLSVQYQHIGLSGRGLYIMTQKTS